MAAITTANLPDATLPVLGTDKTVITRDGTTLNDITITDIHAGLTPTMNTAAPNATVPVEAFLATDSNGTFANIDIAIQPKGTGAFSLQVPNNAISGGNKRGTNAVDLQTSRTAATQVASGAFSFAAGQNNTASGNNSFVAGQGCTAGSFGAALGFSCTAGTESMAAGAASSASNKSFAFGGGCSAAGVYGFSVGSNNVASGNNSAAFGSQSTANGIQGQVAFGHNSNLLGGYQTTLTGLRQVTTGTTATRATADGATAATANQLTLRNNSVFIVEGSVVAYDLTTLDAASFTISALIKRGANAGTTALVGTPVITRDFNDAAAATWAVTVVADTTNGAFGVNVQGAGANQIRWFVELYTQETGV